MDSRAELQRLPSPAHPLSLNLPMLLCQPQARFEAVNVLVIAVNAVSACARRRHDMTAVPRALLVDWRSSQRPFAFDPVMWTVWLHVSVCRSASGLDTRHGATRILSEQSDSCGKKKDNKRNGFRDYSSSRITAMIAPLGQYSHGEMSKAVGALSPDAPWRSGRDLGELRNPKE